MENQTEALKSQIADLEHCKLANEALIQELSMKCENLESINQGLEAYKEKYNKQSYRAEGMQRAFELTISLLLQDMRNNNNYRDDY